MRCYIELVYSFVTQIRRRKRNIHRFVSSSSFSRSFYRPVYIDSVIRDYFSKYDLLYLYK